MTLTGRTKLLSIYWLTFFLFISDRVTSFCYSLKCYKIRSLMSNVSSLKDEIKLSLSHFTLVEACERFWYLLQSLSISPCSISIHCKKGFVGGMS